eukprot:g2748.t1
MASSSTAPAALGEHKQNLQLQAQGFSGHLVALNGRYLAPVGQKNHDRPLFKKQAAFEGAQSSCIYYWNDSDGPDLMGWWCAPVVGGEQVWAHNPVNTPLPPTSGWRVPWHKKETDPAVKMETSAAPEKRPYDNRGYSDGYQAKRQYSDNPASNYGRPGGKEQSGHSNSYGGQQHQLQKGGGAGAGGKGKGSYQNQPPNGGGIYQPPPEAVKQLQKFVKFLYPNEKYKGHCDFKKNLLMAENQLHLCKNMRFDGYDEPLVKELKTKIKDADEEIAKRKKVHKSGASSAMKLFFAEEPEKKEDGDAEQDERKKKKKAKTGEEEDGGEKEESKSSSSKEENAAEEKKDDKVEDAKPSPWVIKTAEMLAELDQQILKGGFPESLATSNGHSYKDKAALEKAVVKPSKKPGLSSAEAKTIFEECGKILAEFAKLDPAAFLDARAYLQKGHEAVTLQNMDASEEQSKKLKGEKGKVEEFRTKLHDKWMSLQSLSTEVRVARARANTVLVQAERKALREQKAAKRAKRDQLKRSLDAQVVEVLLYLESELLKVQKMGAEEPGGQGEESSTSEADHQVAELKKKPLYVKLAQQAEGLKELLRGPEGAKNPLLEHNPNRDPDLVPTERRELDSLRQRLNGSYMERAIKIRRAVDAWDRDGAQHEAQRNLAADVRFAAGINAYREKHSLNTEQEFFDKLSGNDREDSDAMKRKTVTVDEVVDFLKREGLLSKAADGDSDPEKRVHTLLLNCFKVREQRISKPDTDGAVELAVASQSKYAQDHSGELFVEDFFTYCYKDQSSETPATTQVPAGGKSEEFIGKIGKDEVLMALEGPISVKGEKGAKLKRMRVRRERDGVEGWVTMRANRTTYISLFDPHYILTTDCPLMSDDQTLLRVLKPKEKAVLLSSSKNKIMSLVDGAVGTVRSGVLAPDPSSNFSALTSSSGGGSAASLIGKVEPKLDLAEVTKNMRDFFKTHLYDLHKTVSDHVAPMKDKLAGLVKDLESMDAACKQHESKPVETRLEKCEEGDVVKAEGQKVAQGIDSMIQELHKLAPTFEKYDADLRFVAKDDAIIPPSSPSKKGAAQAGGGTLTFSPRMHPGSPSKRAENAASSAILLMEQFRGHFEPMYSQVREMLANLKEKRKASEKIAATLAALPGKLEQNKQAADARALAATWKAKTESKRAEIVKADKEVAEKTESLWSSSTGRRAGESSSSSSSSAYYKDTMERISLATEGHGTLKAALGKVNEWIADHAPESHPKMAVSSPKNAASTNKGKDPRAPTGNPEVKAAFEALRQKVRHVENNARDLENVATGAKIGLPVKAHLEIARAFQTKWKKDHDKHREEMWAKMLKTEADKALSKQSLVSPATVQRFLKKELKLDLDQATLDTLCKQFCSVFVPDPATAPEGSETEKQNNSHVGNLTKTDFTVWLTKVYYRVGTPVVLTTSEAITGDAEDAARELKSGELVAQASFPDDFKVPPGTTGSGVASRSASSSRTVFPTQRIYVEAAGGGKSGSIESTSRTAAGYATISTSARTFLTMVRSRGLHLRAATAYPDGTEVKAGEAVQMTSLPSVEDGLVAVVPLAAAAEERVEGKIPVVVPLTMSIVRETSTENARLKPAPPKPKEADEEIKEQDGEKVADAKAPTSPKANGGSKADGSPKAKVESPKAKVESPKPKAETPKAKAPESPKVAAKAESPKVKSESPKA